MNKRFNSGLFVGCLLLLGANDVMSQNDTLCVPGNLFGATRITNTGAVSTVGGETLYKTPTPNLTNTVAGYLPGLFSTSSQTQPNADRATWTIRGIGTYAGAGYKIFVDGFEVTDDYLDYMSPTEIAGISILKDAAALSTFGMKGSNGIVWVETKRGEVGAPSIDIQIRSGVQNAINLHKPLNAQNFENLYNQAISNDLGRVWTPHYTNSEMEGVNTNWYDEVLKNNGVYTDADISAKGGSEAVRYFLTLGFANQQGLLNVGNTDQTSNDRFTKFNIRANLDMRINKVLSAGVDVSARLQDWNRPNYDIGSLMSDLATYPQNIYPVYDELVTDDLSNFSGTMLFPNNPIGSISGLGWRHDRMRILQGNFKFKEDLSVLLDGLYLQQTLSFYIQSQTGWDKTRNYARYYNGQAQTTDQTTSITAGGHKAIAMEEWKQANFSAGYGNVFNGHSINAVLNFNLSDFKSEGVFGYMHRYVNFNGKFNYAYKERYVTELGFSCFGSDAFAPDNRFGFYPAVSAAWIVSNEEFLKGSNVVELLKIRASAGVTGGAESYQTSNLSSFPSDGRYLYKQYYAGSPIGSFYLGDNAPFAGQGTMAYLFLPNPNVFAEKSVKYNVGVDLNLWNKLDFTVDVFLDKRSNILTFDQSLMDYYGVNIQFNNIGKMTNRGFEASVAYNNYKGEGRFNHSFFGMVTFAKNRVDYMAEIAPAEQYSALTGKPYNTRMGLRSIGFFQLEDFNPDGSLKEGIPEPTFEVVQPGDLRYVDMNDDGYINELDVTEIGAPAYPRWTFSFGANLEWKGFDLSLLLSGSAGSSVNLLDYSQSIAFVNNGNAYPWAQNAWAYYPEQSIDNREHASYPRLTTEDNKNNYRDSSFWIRKNNFLRVRNIELGYDFFHNRRNASISKLRLYVNTMNPFTVSSLLSDFDLDPESGYGYPALKSYNVGIQISF